MTLQNLVGRTLESIETDWTAIEKLKAAARRNIQDAANTAISNENRFDIAYKAVMQLANAALQANGYRTLTSQPGHHQTMVQSLVKTLGLGRERMIEIDALRKQRNIVDYSGDLVTEGQCDACLELAKELENLLLEKL